MVSLTRNLPPWAGRAAALALLVLLLLAVYGFFIGPLVGAYRDTDQALVETGENLARYARIAEGYPALKQQLDRLSARQARSGVYLKGDTDALAAAGLQADVSSTIEQHGGKLRSVQILPVSSDGDFKRVSVRVQLTATLPALARILHALEARRPVVFIDNLDVKNRLARRRAKQNQEESEPQLVIRFDLYGYLRPLVSS